MSDQSSSAVSSQEIDMSIGNYIYVKWDGLGWRFTDSSGNLLSGTYPWASGYSEDILSFTFPIITFDSCISASDTGKNFNSAYNHPNSSFYTGGPFDSTPQDFDASHGPSPLNKNGNTFKITVKSVSSNTPNFWDFFDVTNMSYIPCFSYNTLLKILELQKSLNPKQKLYLMTKTKRNDKKMFRCQYGNLGDLEFTSDHPFLYKNELVDFENIANNHPVIKKSAKEISLDDKINGSESYIYNIYGHYEQKHKNNHFELGPNLVMLGGKMNCDKKVYDKVKEKMNLLEEEIKINKDVAEKISFENFTKNENLDSNELYIVAV